MRVHERALGSDRTVGAGVAAWQRCRAGAHAGVWIPCRFSIGTRSGGTAIGRPRTVGQVADVLRDGAERLLDRLDDMTRRFGDALDVGGRGVVAPMLRARGMRGGELRSVVRDGGAERRPDGSAIVAADEECLPFASGSFDLIVASLSLHWVNDLPGALLQMRQALRPEGLLLASLPALGTLASCGPR